MRSCAVLGWLVFSVSSVVAADWPQWLGPNRDGTVPEKLAPWKGDLKVLWKKPIGEGNSSPVVAEGLVFLQAKVKGKDEESLTAYDAKTGDVKWEQTYTKTPFKPLFGEGPRATPTVYQGQVFTVGNTGVLAAWDAATGKPLWKVESLTTPKKDNLFFGISASPLVAGDKVIVQGGGGSSTGVKAFDRSSGKAVWTAGKDAASYASPAQFGDDIVVLTGANLMSVDAKGEVRWSVPFKDRLNESSTTPIKVGDLYIASSVTAGSIAVKVENKDGKFTPTQVWKNDKLTCYFSTPLPISKEHLYLVTGVASLTSPSITLRCVEVATGKEVWNKPNVGKYHAAMLKLADGNILLHSDKGDLFLLAPNAKEYQELATSKGCGQTWAHPAIANGLIFLRDEKELICLQP